jgi:hypothetical protein
VRSATQATDPKLPVAAAAEHYGWFSRALRGGRVSCAVAVAVNAAQPDLILPKFFLAMIQKTLKSQPGLFRI